MASRKHLCLIEKALCRDDIIFRTLYEIFNMHRLKGIGKYSPYYVIMNVTHTRRLSIIISILIFIISKYTNFKFSKMQFFKFEIKCVENKNY